MAKRTAKTQGVKQAPLVEPTSLPVNRDANAALRVTLALQLRAQRLTYQQVADRAGYASAGACHNAIQRELARHTGGGVATLRREEAAMYDDLQRAIYPLAVGPRGLAGALAGDELPDVGTDPSDPDEMSEQAEKQPSGPNLFAVDRVLTISKARRELLGLDTTREEAGAMPIERRYIGVAVEGV